MDVKVVGSGMTGSGKKNDPIKVVIMLEHEGKIAVYEIPVSRLAFVTVAKPQAQP